MKLTILIFIVFFTCLSACSNRKEKNMKLTDQENLIDSSAYYSGKDTQDYNTGDTVMPFKNYDFRTGNWRCVIKISSEDFDNLSNGIPRKGSLSTSDVSILDKLKLWKFRVNNSDMATLQSSIKIINDGVIVANFGLSLDSTGMGLQSSWYGWISSLNNEDMIKTLQLFSH